MNIDSLFFCLLKKWFHIALMEWVTCEVKNYADIFKRQVFESKQPFSVIADCIQSTVEGCHIVNSHTLFFFLIIYFFK